MPLEPACPLIGGRIERYIRLLLYRGKVRDRVLGFAKLDCAKPKEMLSDSHVRGLRLIRLTLLVTHSRKPLAIL
jgi:hypothetical protein